MTDKALVSYQGQQVWVTLLSRIGIDYRCLLNQEIVTIPVIDILKVVSES